MSRQAKWQAKKLAAGLCSLCGKRHLEHYPSICDECVLRRRQYRERYGFNPKRPGGPGAEPRVEETTMQGETR